MLAALALPTGPAGAQPAANVVDYPTEATELEPDTDGYRSSDLWPAVTLVTLGGGFIAGGVAAVDSGQTGEERCFASGSCWLEEDKRLTGAGVGMLTGGGTAVVFGLTTELTASSEPSREQHSQPMAATGQMLTGAGTATVAGAVGALVYGGYEGDKAWLRGTLAAAGGAAFIAAGVPLWMVGASCTESEAPDTTTDCTERHSTPMMAAGIATTVLGTAALATAAGVAIDMSSGDGDFSAMAAGMTAAPIGVAGLALLGAGIPLTIAGAQPARSTAGKADARAKKTNTALPQVAVGLGSFDMRWQF